MEKQYQVDYDSLAWAEFVEGWREAGRRLSLREAFQKLPNWEEIEERAAESFLLSYCGAADSLEMLEEFCALPARDKRGENTCRRFVSQRWPEYWDKYFYSALEQRARRENDEKD